MVGVKREQQKSRAAEQIVIDFSDYKDRKGIRSEQQLEYVSILSNQIQMMERIDFNELDVLVECLRNGKTLIINLDKTDINKRQKVMDFVCGACYVLKSSIYHISNNIYVVGFSQPDSGEK